MAEIYSAWNLGDVKINNRLVRSATWEGLAEENGQTTARLIEAMATLAQNRVGLIISSNLYVSENGKAQVKQAGIYSQAMVPGLSSMCEAVHKHKGVIAAQLAHGGGHTKSAFIGNTPPRGPSAFFNPLHQEQVEELSLAQIEDIIADFGQAARRAKACGFDAVQLHMAHGYLSNQFLNPALNKRADAYGNRHLFALNVYKQVRQELGAGFPVFAKINSEDSHEGMQTIEHVLPLLAELEGLDAVEVSGGLRWGTSFADSQLSPSRRVTKPEEEGYFFANAVRIKKEMTCPVISVGGWRSKARVEEALEQVDAIAMSRPLISQPDLALLWMAGKSPKARCVSCDKCFIINAQQGLNCAFNLPRQ